MTFKETIRAAFTGVTVADHRPAQLDASSAVMPQVASPFANTSPPLNQVVWADLVGNGVELPVTRGVAIGLPAVARQRHLIAGTAARCPLQRWGTPSVADDATPAPAAVRMSSPLWATRTDGELSPFHRMLWTVDDLIFHGWSLWRAERNSDGTLAQGTRVARERWTTDQVGRIVLDGELVSDSRTVILIPGPHEGILTFGARAIRMAISNAAAASNAARNPSAFTELHYTGDEPMSDDDIDALIARWAAARRGENGGVSFTPANVEVNEHGTHEGQLLITGRNADAVDMSRLVSSPAAMADATNAGASLTYETTTGRNGEFIDYGLALYLSAVEARLSMDDVCPRGQRMTFDTSSISNVADPDPVGPNRED